VVADGLRGEGTLTDQKGEESMNEINDTWYIITDWNGETFETIDREATKSALRRGAEVSKIKRIVFEQGPTTVRITVSTEIYKIRDL